MGTNKKIKNIVVILSNNELEKLLGKWGKKNNVEILLADPNSPDLIALLYDIAIIDRNIINREEYNSYIEYIESVNTPINYTEEEKKDPLIQEIIEIKDDSICILLDNLTDLKYPKLETVIQVRPLDQNYIDELFEKIEKIIDIESN